ncbi:hypothetical protein QZH41_007717 [Actinostola sp. cb2023]|nr:hypothetical protein QZH41_007717 [Actinostola sp. cb2023]
MLGGEKFDLNVVYQNDLNVVYQNDLNVVYQNDLNVVYRNDLNVVYQNDLNVVYQNDLNVVYQNDLNVVYQNDLNVVYQNDLNVVYQNDLNVVYQNDLNVVYQNDLNVVYQNDLNVVYRNDLNVVYQNDLNVVYRNDLARAAEPTSNYRTSMAQSGIKCDDNVLPTYKKMSSGKNKLYRYIIFKITQDEKGNYTKVVVDKTGERDSNFQDMKNDLNKDEARYIVFDMAFHTAQENQFREKIIFLKFVPDTCDRKQRMVYSTTENELKSKLSTATISASYHFDSHSEIDEGEINDEMAKKG